MSTTSDTTTGQHPESAATGPLAGIRVVEMGSLIAGPFCGQLLGDFGADVIKLEDPASGDPMRRWMVDEATGESLWWPVIARNKRSVTVDLRTPEGQDVARRLIATADVLVENFRPGTLERWGLGYDELSRDNPGLVMTRVTGYGQARPVRQSCRGSARSARRWVGCATSPGTRRPRQAAPGSPSATRSQAPSRRSAPAWRWCARGPDGTRPGGRHRHLRGVLAVMEGLVPLYQRGGRRP